jgi:hypothetical protein
VVDGGNVYVLDGRGGGSRLFQDGQFLRTIGKKGQGPGRMNRALCLSRSTAGS